LRAIPGLITIRPGDANEVVEAWRYIMQLRHEPVMLVLSRQALPTVDRNKYGAASGVAKGAYILADAPGGDPEVIVMATGSEVSIAVEAYEKLIGEGVRARVVSMPSWEIFEKESEEYRASVLPPNVRARISVEQASTFGWERYTGFDGARIGMHTFGSSAPIKDLQKKFGFTPSGIVEVAHKLLGRSGPTSIPPASA
jgi:transketolase